MSKIKPGQLAFIYVVPNNPNQEIELKGTAHEITSFNELQKMVRIPNKPLSKEISANNKYKFKDASVHMEHGVDIYKLSDEEKKEIASKLLAEAQANGQDYALMPVPFKDEFWHADINYVSGKKEFRLEIIHATSVSFSYGEGENVSEKIKINGVDVIKRNDLKELIWAYEAPETKKAYVYSLRVPNGKISDEELLDIAKQIIPKAKK